MQSSSELSALATEPEQDTSLLVAGLVERYKADGRAKYSRDGKEALIALCAKPGVSVAKAALVNGVNANLLRKWIVRSKSKAGTQEGTKALLPVLVKPATLRDAGHAEATHAEVVEVMLARGSLRLAASTTNLERLVGLLAR